MFDRSKEMVFGILLGSLLSVFISGTLVIAAAKAGITPGVSPLVILFGWILFASIFKDKTRKFLAISQVAGSAGAAITAGVVFTAPAIQLLAMQNNLPVPDIDIGMLLLASLSGSFMGFGLVGLGTKKFLKDPKLPAPEAVACDRMIRAATAESDEEKPKLGPSLGAGLFAGVLIHFMEKMSLIKEDLGIHFKSLGGANGLAIPASAMFIGIGALLTLPTAILIFIGSSVNYGFGEIIAPKFFSETAHFTRWVGAGAMGVAVLWSLVDYFVLDRKKHQKNQKNQAAIGAASDDALLDIDKKSYIFLWGSVAVGVILQIVMMALDFPGIVPFTVLLVVSLLTAYLLTNLGALLSLQVGSSASPVSGTVFIGLMVLSLFGLLIGLNERGSSGAYFLMPIIIATCTSICAANDSSQDYKTLQLNGFPVKMGFFAQLIGLLAGAITVPLVLYVAFNAYGFGEGAGQLACPQASFYASILDALFIKGDIPIIPVVIGLGFGAIAIVVERIGKQKGVILSSLAFAVGIYLPSFLGIGIMIGALAKFIGGRGRQNNSGILTAAGLITGDAFLKLVFGILILGGISLDPLKLHITDLAQKGIGFAAICYLFGLVYHNYKQKN